MSSIMVTYYFNLGTDEWRYTISTAYSVEGKKLSCLFLDMLIIHQLEVGIMKQCPFPRCMTDQSSLADIILLKTISRMLDMKQVFIVLKKHFDLPGSPTFANNFWLGRDILPNCLNSLVSMALVHSVCKNLNPISQNMYFYGIYNLDSEVVRI